MNDQNDQNDQNDKERKEPHDQYDRLIRSIIQKFRGDLVTWLLGKEPQEVGEVDSVLALTEKRFTDKLLQVHPETGPPFLLHVEFQLASRQKMPLRLLGYLALLLAKLEEPDYQDSNLECVVIYLDREEYRHDPGRVEYKGIWTNFSLRYRVLKLWELDPEPLLAMVRVRSRIT